MNRLRLLLITVLSMVIILTPHIFANVHIIYFKPTDAKDINIVFHDSMIKDIQKYFQSEMTRHGFTDKTFPLELDDDNKLIIHTVNGKHNTKHYELDGRCNNAQCELDFFRDKIEPEIPFRFNNTQNPESQGNVHLFIIGGTETDGKWRGELGFGFTWRGGKLGGTAVVTMDYMNDWPNHYLGITAHELGHAFGLDPGHNNVRESFNGHVIAWGRTTAEWGDRMRILDFEAALISSRPIFKKINLQPKPNKNEDLGVGDDESNKDNGDPISIRRINLLTTSWGSIKKSKRF